MKVVEEIGIARLLGAGPDDRVDNVGPDVAYGTKPEPDVLADRGEVTLGGVHIRR